MEGISTKRVIFVIMMILLAVVQADIPPVPSPSPPSSRNIFCEL